MKSALTEFGKKCRQYRLAGSFTISDQAKALSISPVDICAIETGEKKASIEYINNFSAWVALNFKEEGQLIQLRQKTENFEFSKSSQGVKLYRKLAKQTPCEIRKLKEQLNVVYPST